MLDTLLSVLAPHRCAMCAVSGSLLCVSCLVELRDSRVPLCLLCAAASDARGLCERCAPRLPVERALLFGERSGVLEELVNQLKFERKRAAHRPIAGLLGSLLPYKLEAGSVIVPLPTIRRHVRQRGYDHTALIARSLARIPGATYGPLLRRIGSSVQRGASKRDRIRQASVAFAVNGVLDPSRLYIVVDDIVTTGASLSGAVHALRAAGARRVWVMAFARQPLEVENV